MYADVRNERSAPTSESDNDDSIVVAIAGGIVGGAVGIAVPVVIVVVYMCCRIKGNYNYIYTYIYIYIAIYDCTPYIHTYLLGLLELCFKFLLIYSKF